MADNQKLHVDIIGDSSKLNQALGRAEGRLKKFSGSLSRTGRALTTRLTLPLAAVGTMAVKQAANFEKLQTTLNVLTGSAEEGARAFERLVQFSAKTPFQLADLTKVNNTLMGFGLTTDEAFDSLSMLGDVAGIVGGDLQSIAIAFGQAAAEGRVMTRDLRQFINNGVPILQVLSEEMGVAEGAIMDMASEGKITFELLDRAFKNATAEGGKFEGGMETVSGTLNGLFSTLKDNVNIALAELGQAIADTLNLKEGIPALSAKIRSVVENFKSLTDESKKLIISLAGAAGLAPVLISLLAIVASVITAFTTLAGGYIALGTAIYAATEALDYFIEKLTGLKDFGIMKYLVGPLGMVSSILTQIGKQKIGNVFGDLFKTVEPDILPQGFIGPATKEQTAAGLGGDPLLANINKINEGLEKITKNTREPAVAINQLSSITTTGFVKMEGAILKGGEVLKGFGTELKRFVTIGEAFLPLIGEQLTAAFENLGNGENTIKKLETAVKGLVVRLTAAAAAAAILSFFLGGPGGKAGTFQGFGNLFRMFGGPNLGAMVGAGSSVVTNLSPMAQGGLAFGQTPVMVGDYSGVRSNPEVIAPLNKLKSLIDGGSQNVSGEFVLRGQDLVVALQRAERNRNRFK